MGSRRHALAVYFGLADETESERAQREGDTAARSVLRIFVAALIGGMVAGLLWEGTAARGSLFFGVGMFVAFLIGGLWERRQALGRAPSPKP